jgi:rsbT antagonist protein RsbS
MNTNDIPMVAIQVSRDIVVASIQVDLDDDVLAQFQEDLLQAVHTTGSAGVIFDLSGLETLDSHEFCALRRIITMVKIMGADAVLVGLRPGIVSALIEEGADVDGLQAAINLDAAFAMFQPDLDPEPVPDPDPGLDREEAGTEPDHSSEADGSIESGQTSMEQR